MSQCWLFHHESCKLPANTERGVGAFLSGTYFLLPPEAYKPF